MQFIEKKISVKKNYLFNALISFSNALTQYLLPFITFHIMGVHESGVVSIAISYNVIITAFMTFYTSHYIISDLSNEFEPDDYFRTRILTTILSLIIFIPIILLGQLQSFEKQVVIIFVIMRIFENSFGIYAAYAQNIWKLDYVFFSVFLKNTLFIIIYSVLLLFCKDVLIAIFFSSTVYIIVFFFYDRIFGRQIVCFTKTKGYKQILKIIVKVFPLFISSYIYSYILNQPKLLVGELLGAEKLGYFNFINSLTSTLPLIISFFINPYLRIFSELINEKNITKLLYTLIKLFLIILGVYTCGLLVCHFFGRFFIELIYNKSVLSYSYLLIPTLTTALFNCFQIVFSYLLICFRKKMMIIICSLCCFIVAFLVNRFLILKFDINGANLALLFSNLIYIIIALVVVISSLHTMNKKE